MEDNANNHNKTRVLVADSSGALQAAARDALGRDFALTFVADGDQACRELTSDDTIQAFLTELTLPGVDATALTERVRKAFDPQLHTLPIVIATSGDDEVFRRHAYEKGATDFIAKPFDPIELHVRMCAHISARDREQQLAATSAIDPHTVLYNRHSFLARLDKDRSAAARHGHDLTLLYFALHGLDELFLNNASSLVNGVLKEIGDIIRRQIRMEDTAARVGVNQFALSLPLTNPEGAQVLAERLRSRITQTSLPLQSYSGAIDISVGRLRVPSSQESTPEELLAQVANQAAEVTVNTT